MGKNHKKSISLKSHRKKFSYVDGNTYCTCRQMLYLDVKNAGGENIQISHLPSAMKFC